MPTRRSTLRLAALLAAISMLLPAAASADNRDRSYSRHHARGGMVLVDNPNAAALEVLVDGELVGKVGADSTARFGPFGRGDHKVVTRYRCNQRHLTYRTSRDVVELRRGRNARVQADYVRKGIVDLHNEWVEPMRVFVDGRSVGTVRAGAMLGVFAGERSRVELRDPQGNVGLRSRVSLTGLESTALVLDPAPVSVVRVYNPAPRPVKVSVGPSERVRVRPGETESLRVPTGFTKLVATHRGDTIDARRVLVSPFAANTFDIRLPTTGALRFRNDNRVSVVVRTLDGRTLGRVAPDETAVFRGLPVGDCTLEVVAELRRRTVRERVDVSIVPFEPARIASRLAIRDGRGRYASYTSADEDCPSTGRPPRGRSGRTYARR